MTAISSRPGAPQSGCILYPTRAVLPSSSHSVARLNAQLAAGLTELGQPTLVLQEAPMASNGTELGYSLDNVRNGFGARATAKLLRGVGHRRVAGRLRLAGWYRKAARRIPRAARFIIVNQAIGAWTLRTLLPEVPVFLWCHDVPSRDPGHHATRGILAATALVVASRSVYDRLRQPLANSGFPTPTWILPYPVDRRIFRSASSADRKNLRRRFDKNDNTRLLGFASYLHPHKGLETVLVALRKLHDNHPSRFSLLVAADPAETSSRRSASTAHDYGLDLSFVGRLQPGDLRDFYCALDALLVPSNWEEPYGMVAAEALCCGTCVLASRAGGLEEVCADSPLAHLVDPPNSPQAWAEALVSLTNSKWERPAATSSTAFPTPIEFAQQWIEALRAHRAVAGANE